MKNKKLDVSFEERLFKLEDMVAKLSHQVHTLQHRRVMIWADSNCTMDDALEETWRWLTPQLPEGFSVAEVKWTRSVRNLRILRIDLVYEWDNGLNEVIRQVTEAFVRAPRPFNEEVIVLPHRLADWKIDHPKFVSATEDLLRATRYTLNERIQLKKGIKISRLQRKDDPDVIP